MLEPPTKKKGKKNIPSRRTKEANITEEEEG